MMIADKVQDLFLRLWSSLLMARELSNKGDPDFKLTGYLTVLRHAIQRYPRWREGHIRLARYALELGKLPLAQSSIIAAQSLGNKNSQTDDLVFIRGVLALRLGYPERAIEILHPLQSSRSRKINLNELKEELAAAYGAIGNKKAAVDLLLSVPAGKRSPASIVVLDSAKESGGSF